MIGTRGQIAAAGFLCVLLASPASGQDPNPIGRPVSGVEVRVEGKPETAPAFLALIDIKPGDLLTQAAYLRVSDRLNQLPRFEGHRIIADINPDGSVLLIYDLTPTHPIDSLAFTFTAPSAVSEADLNRLVRERFNGLPALDRRSDVEEEVRAILMDEGYRSAAATAVVNKTHDPDRATLAVTVTPGPQTLITRLDITGTPSPDAAKTLARRGVVIGMPFRERALQTALAEIRDDLRDQRYYTATADARETTFSPDGTGVALVVVIEVGPIVELVVNGDLPGSKDDLIPIKQQGSVDTDLLQDARDHIIDQWRREGYKNAQATYSSTPPSTDPRVITFTVDKGKRFRIMGIDLPAGLQVTQADLEAQKALRIGAWFDQVAVVTALAQIRGEVYQARGYHRAVMAPEYPETPGRSADEGGVIIRPNIDEGPRAIIRALTFDLGERPTVSEGEIRQNLASSESAPYDVRNLVRDREALGAFYESRGFQGRVTSITPILNDAGTEVTLAVRVREGQQITVGEIIVVGNEDVSRETILQEIPLRVGAPYSESARTATYSALRTLPSFRSVRITVDEPLPGETAVRVVISVEEMSSKTFEYGGGVEAGTRAVVEADGTSVDRLEFAPRAFVGVGRRNLGGKNRAVNAFARVSFKRKTSAEDAAQSATGLGFTEYRFSGSFTERYAFRSSTDIVVSIIAEQAIRTSYNFVRQFGTLDVLRALTPQVSVLGRYSLESTKLFDAAIPPDEQPLIDRLFPQVRLSVLSGGALWDRRDDPLQPTKGSLVTAGIDLAPEKLGSEVGFVKSFFEASVYRQIPSPKLLVLAMRGQLGLARGFERTVAVVDEDGNPVLDFAGNPLVQVVEDLPASRRFFAGGASSVRGFQLDRLGVEEILNDAGLSTGGNGLIVFNVELRAFVGKLFGKDVSAVAFVDGGNVFRRVSDIDVSRLRATLGFGVRYDSPLGPLRLDFGFKTDQMQFANARERRWEFHLSIGEVF